MEAKFQNRFFTCVRDAQVDAQIRMVLPEVAEAVVALGLPGFRGLVLGGGYGRGEGGATADHALYNDLDFFVFLEGPESGFPLIAQRLAPLSATFGARLGIDVDFTLRSAYRVHLDERRLMVQELLRGHVPLAPEGFDLAAWSGAHEYPADEVPAGEAARLLMNRGMGLLLARTADPSSDFAMRNLNKAVLGAGDVRLVARRQYAWTLAAREVAVNDAVYSKACAFKRRPSREPSAVASWDEAYAFWLQAYEELFARRGGELRARSLYQAARWVVRRHTLGAVWTLGQDCTVRVLDRLCGVLRSVTTSPKVRGIEVLEKDWKVFN